MKKTSLWISIVLSTCLLATYSSAQTLPVGTPVLEDFYRRMQLLGKLDSNISFMVRPLSASAIQTDNLFFPVAIGGQEDKSEGRIDFLHGKGQLMLLPVSWRNQYNSDHPYGWNDGAMIPSRGYQTMISGGFFAKLGPFTIQLRPEYVYAQNKRFNGFGVDRTDSDLFNYFYKNANEIDAPERFGDKSYSRIFWGQSSIKLNVGPASLGLSNENLWWGPGMRNSIMMSNNAAGFKHLTLNTNKPVRTFIGSFEGQLIAGKLESSGFLPLAQMENKFIETVFVEKNPDWRYLSAFVITYQPKWVPGLFFGLTRSFLTYHDDLNSFSDYFPLFGAFQKIKINSGLGELTNRDQRTSFFTRWVFPKAKAEVYFEYGLNDNSYNLRDFLGSPEHSRAYIFGISKMIPLMKNDQYVKVDAEVTQLSQTADYLTRNAGSYYYHYQVTQGYTHNGEVLGAGIGSGGNLQSLDISWVNGLKQVGFAVERYEHNMDLANRAEFLTLNGLSRRWVDLAFAANGTWNYKNLLFNAKLQGIKSLNYQWVLKDYEPGKYYIPHNDVFNFHGELGVTYRF